MTFVCTNMPLWRKLFQCHISTKSTIDNMKTLAKDQPIATSHGGYSEMKLAVPNIDEVYFLHYRKKERYLNRRGALVATVDWPVFRYSCR